MSTIRSLMIRQLARTLHAVVSFQLIVGGQLALAQTAPVPTSPGTSLTRSANGTPVVNIAAPNAAGVSHNQFSSYDVGSGGLILNNSAVAAASVIGGGTAANPNLVGRPSAGLILNEVTAANAGSQLNGYQEILGPQAQLVIANPWGVTCNGCGFINTPRVTLTTGVPVLTQAGALSGFTITGGMLAIGPGGLDATRQSTLDLLARSMTVGGNIVVGSSQGGVSGELLLLAGANHFDYAGRSATAIAGQGGAPFFAIDSSLLGGMYADRIQLLVTEQGAGVRTAGNLAALAGDLTINATGRIELRGAASAGRDVAISGGDVQVSLGDPGTYLYGGRNLSILAGGSLELDTGSLGALNNVSLQTGGSLNDLGGTGDQRFAGSTGALTVSASGTLGLGGGYWSAPRLVLSGADVQLGTGVTAYGSGASGTAVSITTPGRLSVAGSLYSGADLDLAVLGLDVQSSGVIAAQGGLTAALARGAAGGLENAGILQGGSISLLAAGAAPGTATVFHNAASGQIFADGVLSLGESGSPAAAGSRLNNEGMLAGGAVSIALTDIRNSGTLQASTGLTLTGSTLENMGKDALILGSGDPGGSARIAVASITNSGTLWSSGDLLLSTDTLTQAMAPGAATNPLIGAGRDLSLTYSGRAALGLGDLQAGRDLTITGTSLIDTGLTGAGGADADVRYAGRNLVATVATGGDVVLVGGRWAAERDLRLTGDNVEVGDYQDPVTGAVTLASELQLLGAHSGAGTVALTARAGLVSFGSDAGVFSGGDLAISQTGAFTLGQRNVLQATGTLGIAANGSIDNFGTLEGGHVELASGTATALLFINRASGAVFASQELSIGTAATPAGTILVEAPASAGTGLFGGRLDFHAGSLFNDGMIQAAGPGSVIQLSSLLGNNAGGQIQGFTDASGQGGLTIQAAGISNAGLIYDSSSLTLNAPDVVNQAAGYLTSAGLLTIHAGGGGAQAADNQGTILGGTLDLTFASGLFNGRDPGNPANPTVPGLISALGDATIRITSGATLHNFGTVEAQGSLSLLYSGAGGGSLLNQMSMVPDSYLTWVDDVLSSIVVTGDLGGLARGANGSTDKQHVTVDGRTYYYFDQIGGSTQAFFDTRTTTVQNQAFVAGFDPTSIAQPTIRAGGNLTISGFQDVANNGTIAGGGDVTIDSPGTTGTVENTSLTFGRRDAVGTAVYSYTCRFNTGVTNLPTSCAASPNNVTSDNSADPYQSTVGYGAPRAGSAAFAARIQAGGTLRVTAANIVNSGVPSAFTGPALPGGLVPTGSLSVTPPGGPGARNGATTINVNGAHIPLPTSGNGQFVNSQGPATDPLVESNPLYGLDSTALGSDYLANLLGLKPEQTARRLGDSAYEDYLIQQQVQAQTGQGLLSAYSYQGAMDKALFDNAGGEARLLHLTYGQALSSSQISALTSDIVWLVEQVVQGQKVLVPVVYLTSATRTAAAAAVGAGATLAGGNVALQAGTFQNRGGDIVAGDTLQIQTTGDILNQSGNLSGWNVVLNAGGDIVNSTLVTRLGDATNGTDVAQRTATIQAGGTAVLNAAHDITVGGGLITAARDAALIAGNNVNVQSLALTTNQASTSGSSTSGSQTQRALIAGVSAGGNAVIQGGQDVNIKGAGVAAGGTAVLNAERGNVNVGVLELTDSSSLSQSSTGIYTEAHADAATNSASVGFGVEKKTTSSSTSTTNGLASSIAGGQVAISTGKGDVNINGSQVTAGTGGLAISSAGDVNITAYQNTSTTTESTDRTRVGYQAEANADGAYHGARQSGQSTTTTTDVSLAQTSALSSAGDVSIAAKGTIRNQGTQVNAAGDVTLQAQSILNEAARSTRTTTTTTSQWEAKEQKGITTNGTGSSIAAAAQGRGDQVTVGNLEVQDRLTASHSTDSSGSHESVAQATQIGAGGNITVIAGGTASDEGTQYSAGKDIVISAADYQNKAAANITGGSDEQTSGSGQATVGLDTTASVNIAASAQGSHTRSDTTQSTAQTGSIKAGGQVLIQARTGDVTLEGTQVAGTKGVGIGAAGNISVNQANNTTVTTSSEQSGGANASVSVSLVGAGAAVGAGASTRLADSRDQSSQAVVANIDAGKGGVRLSAGGNLTSQGAGIKALGDVALAAGGDVSLLAATDTKDRTGSVNAGGASLNVGFGTGEAGGSGSVGANASFEQGSTDYHEKTQTGSTVSAGGGFSVTAGHDAHLVGTEVTAGSAALSTGGNLTLESAQHTVRDNSQDISGDLGLTASKGQGTAGAAGVSGGTGGTQGAGNGGNAAGGNAQIGVVRSRQDIETNTNAQIRTSGATTVAVGGDLALKGANIAAAGGVSGQVTGALTVETRTDKVNVDQTNVTGYAGVGPVGGSGGGSTGQRVQEGVSTAANHVAQDGVYAGINTQKKDDVTVGTASGISGGRGGINVGVGGDTSLVGATNTARDFRTQGQTTVTGVQTHSKDSGTSLNLTGTVATAAGSKDGSGGTYGLTIHVPSAGGRAPAAGRPAAAPAPGEEAPAAHRPGEPADASPYGSRIAAPEEPVAGARAPAAPAVHPEGAVPAHEPAIPAAHPQAGPRVSHAPAPQAPVAGAHAPAVRGDGHDNGAASPYGVRIAAAPPAPAAPPEAHAPAGARPHEDLYGNAVGQDAPVLAHAPAPEHPQAVLHGNPPAEGAAAGERAHVPQPAGEHPQADALYGNEGGEGGHPAAPGVHPAEAPEHPAVAPHPGAAPAEAAPIHRAADEPDPLAEIELSPVSQENRRSPEVQKAVRELVEGDARARQLSQLGAGLSPLEHAAMERNLAEILVFTARPRNAGLREPLLAALEESLKPPPVNASGQPLLRLHPQYIGEDQKGFAHWHQQKITEVPGTRTGDAVEAAVKYLSPSQQQQRRLHIGPEGELLQTGNRPLADGKWIFVVNKDGQLIADKPQEGVLHHSSLSAGQPVLAAGEFTITGGRLTSLSNQSGHFRTDRAAFKRLLSGFLADGVDLSHAVAPLQELVSTGNGGFSYGTVVRNLLADPQLPQGVKTSPLALQDVPAPAPAQPAEGPAAPPGARVQGAAWSEEAREAITDLFAHSAELRALHDQGGALPAKERALLDRNIAEIEAYSKTADGASRRQGLLEQVQRSLQGPQVVDGVTLFPIAPAFVGESAPQFDNWAQRQRRNRENQVPGTMYERAHQLLIPSVQYFNPDRQRQARLTIHEGRLTDVADRPLADGEYIFVVDRDGRLLATKPEKYKVHHSSLSAGEPVRVAGQLTIAGGQLTKISNQSGHFRPTEEAFRQFLGELAGLGVQPGQAQTVTPAGPRNLPPVPALPPDRRRILAAPQGQGRPVAWTRARIPWPLAA